MTTRMLHPLAAVLLVVALAPAAYAGDHGGARYDPYAAAGRAPVCTQAELRAGIDVDDCGRVIRAATVARRAGRQTTN